MLAFDDLHLDPVQKRLLRGGNVVPVQPKVFDLLLFFAERPGQLLSHDTLMTGVWADTFVGESTLTFYIHSVRKLLGSKAEGRCYIETVPKRGYRFVGNVVTVDSPSSATDLSPSSEINESAVRPRRFARNTTLSIAAVALLCVITGAWLIQGSGKAQTEKIAVLPFRSLARQDPDLGAHLTQALARELSKIADLESVALDLADNFAANERDQIEAARRSGAGLVLSGTLTADASAYSFDAVLRRADDGAEVFRSTVDTKIGSRIDVAQLAAIGIAKRINDHLRPVQLKLLQFESNVPAGAVTNYTAGQKILTTGDLTRRNEMVRHFQQAIDLAPNWPLGYSGLAEALISSDEADYDWERAEKAARDALNIDPNEPNALAVLALLNQHRYRNWTQAEELFKKSLTHDPGNVKTLTGYADLLTVQARFVEANESLDKALAIEPFSHQIYVDRCEISYFENKYEKARNECNIALALEADYWDARKRLFWIFVQQKAQVELGDLIMAGLSEADRKEHPFMKSLENGSLYDYWLFSIESRLKRSSGTSLNVSIAMHYMQINERTKAIEHLEKSLAENEPLLERILVDPVFAPIKDEPRFIDLTSKIGLASVWLRAGADCLARYG